MHALLKVSYAHQACMYLIKNTEQICSLMLWNIITIENNVFLF